MLASASIITEFLDGDGGYVVDRWDEVMVEGMDESCDEARGLALSF